MNDLYEYNIYLAGTCNNSLWRSELLSYFNKNIKYFDPYTKDWNHEFEISMKNKKEQCKYILYVITCEMKGVLAIANLVELANKIPDRLLFCYLPDGFDNEQIASLDEVKYLVEEHNVKTFASLIDIANFINNDKE